MTAYEAMPLRYRPDLFSEEFANCGLLVILKREDGTLIDAQLRIERRSTQRFSHFFADLWDKKSYSLFSKNIQIAGEDLLNSIKSEASPDVDVRRVASEIRNDIGGVFAWGNPVFGITFSPQQEIDSLYFNFVTRHFPKTEKTYLSDKDLWESKKEIILDKIFKTPKTSLFKVEEPPMAGVDIPTHLSWRNGTMQFLEPVSFTLERESMQQKVITHLGRISLMSQKVSDFKFSFFTSPPKHERDLGYYRDRKSELKDNSFVRAVMEQDELPEFIETIINEAK